MNEISLELFTTGILGFKSWNIQYNIFQCNFKQYLFLASQCQDDKTMDCAKLNEMFDICKDIHDAKRVCPNFCNLCGIGNSCIC
jgi:hypothetical protein